MVTFGGATTVSSAGLSGCSASALHGQNGRASFQKLLENATSRLEIVVTFLAVLELIKRRKIEAKQEQMFGEIELVAIEEWTEDEATLAELEFE
jgi:segregation and condensation protein A